jgi:hypothetical protein
LQQQLGGGGMMQQQSPMGAGGVANGGFQGAMQNAMGGNVRDLSGANGALQGFFQNPNGRDISTGFGNQYQNQQYVNPELQNLGTNFGAGQSGMANLSGFGNAAQSNQQFNPMNSQFTGGLQQLMGMGAGQMQNGGGFSAAGTPADVALQGGMSYGDAYNTLGQDPLAERNRMKANADLNARFGAEGAGALGTGAQFALGNQNAEFIAQDASARRGQAMQLMGQDLNERSTGANVGLQNRGQNVQTNLANMQGGLQGAQNQNNMMGQLLGAAGQARGQDFNSMLQQQQMGSQQGMFNAGQSNDMQAQMLNSLLQNQQLGNQFGLSAQQMNNNAMQSNNQNSLNSSQFQNNFNQNNAQNAASFGQQANNLNSQNGQANNNLFAQIMGQGMNLNQMGNQNAQNMLAQMFQSMQQSNQLGTAQRQTIQQPSVAGQIANAGLGLLGGFMGGGGSLGGLFGGGQQQIPSLPNQGPGGRIGLTPGGGTSFGPMGSYRPPTPMMAPMYGGG